jgi:hypothetical protein
MDLLLIGDALRVSLYREALSVLQPTQDAAGLPAIDLTAAVVAGQEVLFRRLMRDAAARA